MAFGSASESSHIDGNQERSLVLVQGTLGTADLGGTAHTMAWGGDPVIGAAYVEVLGTVQVAGASAGTNVNIVTGTQQTLGTVGVLNTGTLGLVTRIGNIGTIESGTVTTTLALNTGTITTIAAGTQNTLGTVGVINTGTLLSSGSTTGVGVVTALTSGSVTMQVGTLTTGTLQNLVTGTINALAAGTLSPISTIGQLTFGTIGTTGVTVFGTLAGGTSTGAGTEIFVTSLSLTMPSTAGSQDVSIGFGTSAGTFHSGTGRIVRGNFTAGGGIQKAFNPPINSGTNAQLCYFQAGAGTVNIDITYFITPSTL